MTAAPPLPAVVVGAGLVLNLRRSRRRDPSKPTISRWCCRHKRVAVTTAVVGSCWLTAHWAMYVIDP